MLSKNSKFSNIFYVVLVTSILVHIGSLVLGKTIFSQWRWVHDPVHAGVEIFGSMIAFFVAQMIIMQENLKRGTSYNIIIANALVGMGIFDCAHALFHAGHHFVLYHSLATFWGGLLFSLVLLPSKIQKTIKLKHIKVFSIVTLLVLVLSYFIPVDSIRMLENKKFTDLAIFLNLSGGILLILSSIKIFLQYLKTKKVDDILFFLHCLLFGLAATMFMESSLWDFPWWCWHFLRLAAYVTAMLFSIIAYKELSLDRKVQDLYELLDNTEKAAKIGGWSLNFLTSELKWSDETYRIHELEVGSELILEEAINFYHPDHRDIINSHVQAAIKDGIEWKDDLKLITSKGREIWVRSTGKVIRAVDNSPVMARGTFQDISEEKMAYVEKDKFLSVMSHEMRTPLTSMIGMTDLLEETELSKDQKEKTHLIKQSSETLLALINDILDFSKLSNQELTLRKKTENLAILINEVVEVITPSIDQDRISLSLESELENEFVLCDSLRLKQIFFNILGNSIKFTSDGSINIVVAKKRNIDTLDIEIKVSDTGRGIHKDFLPYLFSPFKQDESIKQHKHGTGLGLSITKKLVTIMGGEMSVESEVNKGTTFKVCLPFSISKEEESLKLRPIDIPELKDLNILIADDIRANRIILKGMLNKTGCNLFVANGGEDSFTLFKERSYDLLILDVLMPDMNGTEVIKEIRRYESLNNLTPVKAIAYSAFSFDNDIDEALECGFDSYLIKPANKRDMYRLIQEVLSLNTKGS